MFNSVKVWSLVALVAMVLQLSPKSASAVVTSAASVCPVGTAESATNNVVNGNFNTLSVGGVPQGFSSEFAYVNEGVNVGDNEVSIRTGTHTQPFVVQGAFPGDPARGVPAATNWLYANGNANPTATAIWAQDVTVTPGQNYVFYLYASNAIDPSLAPSTTASWAEPAIGLEVDGAAGSQTNLVYETVSDDWALVQTTFFSGASTSVTLRILDFVVSNTVGDDVAIASINVRACDTSVDPDIDGDLIANSVDLDDDNDGIPDTVEGGGDADSDGVINSSDLDSDNDGVFDAHEAWPGNRSLDGDNDGVLDAAMAGSGANGLLDSLETAAESGLVDYDGDTVADSPFNTDNGDDPDFLDTDSDNDTLSDATENFFRNNAGFDGDGDGRVGVGTVTVDAFGVATSTSAGAIFYSTVPLNSDTDSLPDRRDLDSDGDGVSDQLEGAGDSDGDGRSDFRDADDFDQDGVSDDIDIDDDNDGIPDAVERTPGGADVDSDSDGVFDRLDPDSDNDGIFDLAEASPLLGAFDADNNGQLDAGAVGANGLLDAIETSVDSGSTDFNNDGAADAVANTDGDALADFRDLDTDNDGIPDALESGDSASVSAGRVAGTVSPDGVPLASAYAAAVDSDNDGVANFRDSDSDADGVSDTVEAGLADSDQNGLVDGLVDANGDGMHDGAVISLPDSDNDGAADVIEPGDTANDPDVIGGLTNVGLQTGLNGYLGSGTLNPLFGLLLGVSGIGAMRRHLLRRSRRHGPRTSIGVSKR